METAEKEKRGDKGGTLKRRGGKKLVWEAGKVEMEDDEK